MNRFPLLSKTAVIGFLMLLLLIPLGMVTGVIQDRMRFRDGAIQDVSRAHSGPQVLSGPVLYVPYTETFVRTVVADVDKHIQRQETVQVHRELTVFPKVLDTRSQLDTETRWRGIFPVTVYTSGHDSTGRWVVPAITPQEKEGRITLGQPWLMVGVSDVRGLIGRPRLELAGQALEVVAAPAGLGLPLGLAAAVPASLLTPGAVLDAKLTLALAGTRRMGYLPLADDNTITLSSSWPHPRFDGDFLPRSRTVSADGFEASWAVSSLSSHAQQQFLVPGKGEHASAQKSLGVTLADPVDAYRLSERASKYGLMFVLLTFAAFFVWETVKGCRIHPMQYLLVGAALVLFFLLLLSLAEHTGFLTAYAVATTASLALLTHYLRHVLGGWGLACRMGGMLLALFGVLYGILVSEDNALLMGSVLLFGVLAAVMVATRKVDWYTAMGRTEPKAGPGAAAVVAG